MQSKKNLEFIDLLLYMSKHKRFIIITVIFASIAALIYSLFAPQYWKSTATFLPSKEEGLSSMRSIVDLRSSLFEGGLQPASSELIMLMKSNQLSEDVIKHFDLVAYLDLKDKDSLVIRQKALEALKEKIVKFSIDEETGLVSVHVLTKDKYLSANIANYYCNILDQFNKKNRITKGQQTRVFIEERLDNIKSDIDSLALAIKHFQQKYNVIDVSTQTSEVIDVYSDLISKKTISDFELKIKQRIYSDSLPFIQELKYENQLLAQKIKELEYLQSNSDSKYILKLDEIPNIMLEYSNMKLNMKILTTVYEFLYPEYESAKIKELKSFNSIDIIDVAKPSGKRSYPKRAIICIITFFTSIIFSIFVSIIIELGRNYFKDENYSKIFKEIKENILH